MESGGGAHTHKILAVGQETISAVAFVFHIGMVSDKKVFPTKDSWVSLARNPIIPDSKELEKVFKHRDICLLNLPPPEKKRNNGTIILNE